MFIDIKTSMLAYSVVEERLTSVTIAKYFSIVSRCILVGDFIVFEGANKRLIVVLFWGSIVLVDNLDKLKV